VQKSGCPNLIREGHHNLPNDTRTRKLHWRKHEFDQKGRTYTVTEYGTFPVTSTYFLVHDETVRRIEEMTAVPVAVGSQCSLNLLILLLFFIAPVALCSP